MIEQPLAYRLRPTCIDDVVGQNHLVGEKGFVRKIIEQNKLYSLIFFGPPGTGKTTMATIIAKSLNLQYRFLNATINNKKDLEIVIDEADLYGHMIVIMDEVHRLNKDKQDFLLPHIESGLITLIGATTANPYHSINPAIRSRCHLLQVNPLETNDIIKALKNALKHPNGLKNEYTYDEKALEIIAKLSGGDIRYALNQLEICATCCSNKHIDVETVSNNNKVPQYMIDSDEDGHYDAVSALQKSIRGSDVDAALYYLARLITAGDLESIERRLTVTAYEDVGLANPQAVTRCIEAIRSAKAVGFPEAMIPLGFAVVDLCLSPKSKSANNAIHAAVDYVKNNSLPVPKYLRLTPVGLKENQKYPYDRPDIWPKLQYLPEEIKDIKFYEGEETSSYERALLENYKKLHSYVRSSDLVKLRKK